MNEEIIRKFLRLNPKLKKESLLWRADGRLEWLCEHGIGHTVYSPSNSDFVHGCDGCCKQIRVVKDG